MVTTKILLECQVGDSRDAAIDAVLVSAMGMAREDEIVERDGVLRYEAIMPPNFMGDLLGGRAWFVLGDPLGEKIAIT